MNQRKIGTTDLLVHPIGFGAMHLSIDREKRPSEADSIAMMQRAIDEAGLDFIDTADAYCVDSTEVGHNERTIAAALVDGRREKVLVATKGGCIRPEGRWERDGRPEHLRGACEASLRALGTDTIDLYQLHTADSSVPLEDSVGTLAELQKEGKIRHVGVSNLSLEQLQLARGEAEIVSIQNQYSVMNRRDQDPIIDYCEAENITYLPWNPVGGRGNAPEIGAMYEVLNTIATAHDTSPHSIALAWLLQRSPVVIPIPGTTKYDHLVGNLGASEITLSAEDVERLNELGG